MTPQQAQKLFLHALDTFEAKLKPQIVADKATFIAACQARYDNDKTPNFFDLVDKHQQQVFDTLKAHYSKVIPAFGIISLAQVKSRRFKDTGEQSLFHRLTQDWVHREGLKRSKLIADTSEADVLAAISAGLEAEEGTSAISTRIGEVIDISTVRAELIARTETHAAATYAGVESVRDAQDKLGVKMLKQWLPTLDGRTRPAHAAMEGSEPIPMDDRFIVDGEQLDRPGDPAGSAENVINCRCALAYEEAQ